jgi:hypothetical protein
MVSALNPNLQVDPSGPITGQNCFMDMNVEIGNSYFYRVMAVAVNGDTSDWAYRGVKMSDDVFDQKLDSILTNDERVLLTDTFDATSLKQDFLTAKLDQLQTSFGFSPSSEKPTQPPAIYTPPPSVFTSSRKRPAYLPTVIPNNQPSPLGLPRVVSPVQNQQNLQASYQPFSLDGYAAVKTNDNTGDSGLPGQ